MKVVKVISVCPIRQQAPLLAYVTTDPILLDKKSCRCWIMFTVFSDFASSAASFWHC
ncbi:unnamed protein product [Spirodela intermedia]|uniref:Uncharacterized protein n=2 Tax=Spirodela intermedia TaxID=51605 RepID=A0A7I8JYV3_SPIIN|nr:unnamed protein product [Spirodela intermedia]CAA6654244.1 unnamed protein product [Spirodela intermedia]CAA7388593.1 unnamed protein product [Spirodela intermedia]